MEPFPRDLGIFGGMFGCFFGLIMFAFTIFVFWKIFSKSGNPGALSLLMLIPIVNLGLLIWFAFSEWPIERELKSRHLASQPPPPQYPPQQYPPQQPPQAPS